MKFQKFHLILEFALLYQQMHDQYVTEIQK